MFTLRCQQLEEVIPFPLFFQSSWVPVAWWQGMSWYNPSRFCSRYRSRGSQSYVLTLKVVVCNYIQFASILVESPVHKPSIKSMLRARWHLLPIKRCNICNGNASWLLIYLPNSNFYKQNKVLFRSIAVKLINTNPVRGLSLPIPWLCSLKI